MSFSKSREDLINEFCEGIPNNVLTVFSSENIKLKTIIDWIIITDKNINSIKNNFEPFNIQEIFSKYVNERNTNGS
jgi:hypothetical protein